MNSKDFQKIYPLIPGSKAVLLVGPTGVGKSAMAKWAAEKYNIPLIDQRLATKQEGDISGYPDIEKLSKTGVLTFAMDSWFVRATREPCLLMLDELNRALPAVRQGVFQLVYDRELGADENGIPYKLHPETRIMVGINAGAEYEVDEMDPALVRRFWKMDIDAHLPSWIEWASNKENPVDRVLIQFLKDNPKHFAPPISDITPGEPIPCPATWDDVDQALKFNKGFSPSEWAGRSAPEGVHSLCAGYVGTEASMAFRSYVQNLDTEVSAEDVLDRWSEVRPEVRKLPVDRATQLIDRLMTHLQENTWTKNQIKNFRTFARELHGSELAVHLMCESLNVMKGGVSQGSEILDGAFRKELAETIKTARELGTKK